MTSARPGVLNGWKEIAGYVARDIRTVERWEKQRGLPVRRVPGAGRANVYAHISELEEWLKGSTQESDSGSRLAGVERGSRGEDGGGLSVAEAEAFAGAGNLQSFEVRVEEKVGGPLGEVPANLLAGLPALAEQWERRAATLAGAWTREREGQSRRGTWVALACLALLLAAGAGVTISYAVRARGRTAKITAGSEGFAAAGPPIATKPSRVAGVEELYLRGMYLYEQRRPETLDRALQKFSEAVARDPGYAPAYVGLANTYTLLREYSAMSDSEAYPKAKAAAERAVALDPNLAQAHASLGFIDYFWTWDAVASEREFQRAEELDPGLELAHHWHGSVLTHEGRYAEAVRELDLAEHLAPSSSAVLTSRALALGLSGRRDDAVSMIEEMLQQGLRDSKDQATRDEGTSTAHAVLGILFMQEPADVGQALEEFRRCSELRHNPANVADVELDERNLKTLGLDGMRRAALEREEKLHPGPNDRTMRMAYMEAGLGMADRAFADVAQVAGRHDTAIEGIWMSTEFRPLHGDPRFTRLRASMGLPPMH